MKGQPHRLPHDAAHGFGGSEIDRGKPLRFRLNGRRIDGYAGDTILSAALANGIDAAGLDNGTPLALDERFAPPVLPVGLAAMPEKAVPMDRMPAVDGLELISVWPRKGGAAVPDALTRFFSRFGSAARSLGHHFNGASLAFSPHLRPEVTLSADFLVIGGGVAGLSAAEAATAGGKSVILVERRPWLGGDARYFGAIDNEENPETLIEKLRASLGKLDRVTILTSTEALGFDGETVVAHQLATDSGVPHGRMVALAAPRIVLATGTFQRLPVFAGNRLPGVVASPAAFHRAERHGVWRGKSALFTAQTNFAYRLALRAHDAGINVGRVIDVRVHPQSRFVDFSKASGFQLASGLVPKRASLAQDMLMLQVADPPGREGGAYKAEQLVVSGIFQPDLTLWMLAGGGSRWVPDSHRLEAVGHLDHIALAGAAAGYRNLSATIESGRAAILQLNGKAMPEIADRQIDTNFETADAPTTMGTEVATPPAYLDGGAGLVARRVVPARKRGKAAWSPLAEARPLAVGDVAASVELRAIAPADAGVIAEERSSAGARIADSGWAVPGSTPLPVGMPIVPAFLAGRFGPKPIFAIVAVDETRSFEVGSLVYANSAPDDPLAALGVIVGPAPGGRAGGMALLAEAPTAIADRFIVRDAAGPVPVRILERIKPKEPKPAG